MKHFCIYLVIFSFFIRASYAQFMGDYKLVSVSSKKQIKEKKLFADYLLNSTIILFKMPKDSSDTKNSIITSFAKNWTLTSVEISDIFQNDISYHKRNDGYSLLTKKWKDAKSERIGKLFTDPKQSLVYINSGSLSAAYTYQPDVYYSSNPYCYLMFLTGPDKEVDAIYYEAKHPDKQYIHQVPFRNGENWPTFFAGQEVAIIKDLETKFTRMSKEVPDSIYRSKIKKNDYNEFYGNTRDRLLYKTIYFQRGIYKTNAVEVLTRNLKVISKQLTGKVVEGAEIERLVSGNATNALIVFPVKSASHTLYIAIYDCAEKRIICTTTLLDLLPRR